MTIDEQNAMLAKERAEAIRYSEFRGQTDPII
jgi:hypothetical protein